MIPNPGKANKGGEDAFYVNNRIICVTDGVKGWGKYGVDPGLYSKQYCKNIGKIFEQNQQEYIQNLKHLIQEAHYKTKEDGSTTVCVVSVDQDKPLLYSSYIGDSGYVIYRKSENNFKKIFKSQQQYKRFNVPYSIGSEGDSPTDALVFQHQIQQNDLIVVGSDGLFDNIDENQILSCINPFLEISDIVADLDLIAQIIAKFAFKMSQDPLYNSPFAKKAYKNYLEMRGGKQDDITVIVAQVQLKQ